MCKSQTAGPPGSAKVQAKKRMGNYGNFVSNALLLSEDFTLACNMPLGITLCEHSVPVKTC